jgi:POT family proton-dependent oligopeptide transporter
MNHPRGLQTLFFTEMWERFSYYGMRALLVLFMTAQIQRGGLGLTDRVATAIYGLYVAGVYLSALPGGWIADRLLGAQRALMVGGSLIALGHFTLALPSLKAFYLGLTLVVLGTGLLKPNISALVGLLYPEGGARRDAGFTIFYMGINLGAAIGPLVCGSLGERINWHYGFGAAGIGMVLGLVQFWLTRHHLGNIGLVPAHRGPDSRRDQKWLAAAVAGLVILIALCLMEIIPLEPVRLAQRTSGVIVGMAAAFFAWAFFFAGLGAVEKRRVGVILILFIASALFWSGYEQAGSSLNLFAERYTERSTPFLSQPMPASWFQSLPALFVIVFAPVVAGIWVWMAKRGRNPALGTKMGWGLILLALGFLVVALASKRALASGPVWPTWLVATYLLHVFGELLISPVGLSSVTKLAPPRLVGQMMGIWFLGTSLGNLMAGLFAGEVSGENAAAMPARFLQVVLFSGSIGLILLLFTKPIRRLMPDVE